MDLEDLYLPTAFVLLTLGISIFIAIEIPELYRSLHLGFLHFVISMILVAASLVFVALDYFLGWGRPYEPATFPSEETVRAKPIGNKPSPRKYRRKTVRSDVDPPTKEELQRLREALGIGKGSLQYKKRGQGIYHVTYEDGKHHWKHLGSWSELKEKLEG